MLKESWKYEMVIVIPIVVGPAYWKRAENRGRTSPGSNTLQRSSCTATYHPSRKLSKLDEPDVQGTAGEVGTSS